jgi:hypothetical protein
MTDQGAIAFGFGLGREWIDRQSSESSEWNFKPNHYRIFSFELARYPIEAAKKSDQKNTWVAISLNRRKILTGKRAQIWLSSDIV